MGLSIAKARPERYRPIYYGAPRYLSSRNIFVPARACGPFVPPPGEPLVRESFEKSLALGEASGRVADGTQDLSSARLGDGPGPSGILIRRHGGESSHVRAAQGILLQAGLVLKLGPGKSST